MLRKSLIGVVLLIIALASNGAGPATASSTVASAPGSETGTVCASMMPRRLSANTAKNCVKSFIKRIHYRRPVASVSKTSTAACRSKFGIEQQYKLTQSKKPIAEIVWTKPKSKSTQPKKTSESKLSIRDENQNFRSDERRYDNPGDS